MGAKLSSELPLEEQLAEETPVDLVEIAGTIKWFDASKGYGFIIPDNGLPDVLLHVTCLRRGGFQTAYEGARVVCEAFDRPKGLQAFRVLSMDEATAVRPPQETTARTHTTVEPTSELERAVVKWFNRVRGSITRRSQGGCCPRHRLRPGHPRPSGLRIRYGTNRRGVEPYGCAIPIVSAQWADWWGGVESGE